MPGTEQARNPTAAVLAKKLKLWHVANEPRPSPIPEVRTEAALPVDLLDSSHADPSIVMELSALRVFDLKGWEPVCSDVALIVSKLSPASRERLVESLSLISSPPPVEPKLVRKWLSAVNSLLPSSYPTAIMEFFQLAWMWEQLRTVTGLDLERVMALFFRALRGVGEGPRSAPMIHFLLQLAGRWPERFCFWLDRTATGGPDVIQALKLAESMTRDAAPHARETLLDFGAEMGWRFLDDESLPLWRAVGRLGELLLRRIRGIAIPVQSMQLLAGVLGQIEKSGAMESVLSEARVRVASSMFGEQDPDVVEEALAMQPEVHGALQATGEIELIVQVTALRGSFANPRLVGEALVKLAVLAGGGRLDTSVLLMLIEKFEGQVKEAQVLDAVDVLSGISGSVPIHPVDTWFRLIRLVGAGGEDRDSSRAHRNAMARVLEALVMQPDPGPSLDVIEEILTIPNLSSPEVFQAAALLLRTNIPADKAVILRKTGQCARLLSLLSPVDRDRLLSSIPPQWLTALAAEETDSFRSVCDALVKLDSQGRMPRFLDRIVSPLLEEISARGDVFEEYLAAAVVEYNRMPAQGRVRDTEHELLKRLFRTGDGAKTIDNLISDLLKVPGLEGERASSLIETVRTLCSAFGRQAAWQDPSDATLAQFLEKGLPRIISALVDCPEALDTITPSRMMDLVGRLMPSNSVTDADPQIARWQTRTGASFFGMVLPTAIEILPDEPGTLALFVESISDQAMRSVQGLPAGAGYLNEVAGRLEHLLIESYAAKIRILGGRRGEAAPEIPENWAADVYSGWSSVRASEAALMKEATQVSRILTGDRKIQRVFVHQARKLWEGLSRAGLLARPSMLRNPREGIALVSELAHGELLELFRLHEQGEGLVTPQTIERAERVFSRRTSDHSGESASRTWRMEVFTPLGNCLIDLLLLDGARTPELDTLTDGFLEVAEFLGNETGGDELLLAFQRCLSSGSYGVGESGVAQALKAAEKQLFRPLWRRRAMSRIELVIAGMGNREKLVDRLLDRVAREPGVVSQVKFLRRFGPLFLTIEEVILEFEDKRQELGVRDCLNGVWLLAGSGREPAGVAEAAREAFEAASEVFRSIRRRKGEITAVEAEEISAEMRRRYRDNADVVATLLRWTLDPAREELLGVLEGHPVLLETISRDTELIHLMDGLFSEPGFLNGVSALADDPEELKDHLLKMAEGRRGALEDDD